MNAYTCHCTVDGCPFVVTVTVVEQWPSVPVYPYLIDHCRYVASVDTGANAELHTMAGYAMTAAVLGPRTERVPHGKHK